MKQCDLCNAEFIPPGDAAENSREIRYCHLCSTDRYRRLMCEIHEAIGISGYTIREIKELEDIIKKHERLIAEIYHKKTTTGSCNCRLCSYHRMEIQSLWLIPKVGIKKS